MLELIRLSEEKVKNKYIACNFVIEQIWSNGWLLKFAIIYPYLIALLPALAYQVQMYDPTFGKELPFVSYNLQHW